MLSLVRGGAIVRTTTVSVESMSDSTESTRSTPEDTGLSGSGGPRPTSSEPGPACAAPSMPTRAKNLRRHGSPVDDGASTAGGASKMSSSAEELAAAALGVASCGADVPSLMAAQSDAAAAPDALSLVLGWLAIAARQVGCGSPGRLARVLPAQPGAGSAGKPWNVYRI